MTLIETHANDLFACGSGTGTAHAAQGWSNVITNAIARRGRGVGGLKHMKPNDMISL
jgi:hypothetical protein